MQLIQMFRRTCLFKGQRDPFGGDEAQVRGMAQRWAIWSGARYKAGVGSKLVADAKEFQAQIGRQKHNAQVYARWISLVRENIPKPDICF